MLRSPLAGGRLRTRRRSWYTFRNPYFDVSTLLGNIRVLNIHVSRVTLERRGRLKYIMCPLYTLLWVDRVRRTIDSNHGNIRRDHSRLHYL